MFMSKRLKSELKTIWKPFYCHQSRKTICHSRSRKVKSNQWVTHGYCDELNFTVFRGTLLKITLCIDWLGFLSTTSRQGIFRVTLSYTLNLYSIVVIKCGRVFFIVRLLRWWSLCGAWKEWLCRDWSSRSYN